MYGVTVVTAPTVEPISLAEAKQHLRFEATVEDALISALIVAARKHCETATRRAFVTQTLRLTRDTFPTWKECYQFRLPQPPLQSVTNIQYIDSDGDTQTVSASDYVVDATSLPGRIGLADGAEWPTDVIEQIGAVKVNYVAGYGLAASVPETIKQAMLLLIGHWFVNREAVGNVGGSVAMAVDSLLRAEWSGELVGDFG